MWAARSSSPNTRPGIICDRSPGCSTSSKDQGSTSLRAHVGDIQKFSPSVQEGRRRGTGNPGACSCLHSLALMFYVCREMGILLSSARKHSILPRHCPRRRHKPILLRERIPLAHEDLQNEQRYKWRSVGDRTSYLGTSRKAINTIAQRHAGPHDRRRLAEGRALVSASRQDLIGECS